MNLFSINSYPNIAFFQMLGIQWGLHESYKLAGKIDIKIDYTVLYN